MMKMNLHVTETFIGTLYETEEHPAEDVSFVSFVDSQLPTKRSSGRECSKLMVFS